MKIKYEDITFYSKALRVIGHANQIIERYQKQGFDLTLRQLYYRFVAQDLFEDKYSWNGRKWVKDPNGTINADPNYNMLGIVISNARRAGLIDWDAIVDRTRYLRTRSTWNWPVEIVDSAADSFRLDPWATQDSYIELWFEKDALLGIFQRAAEKYRIPYYSSRGYSSDSEMWAAGVRLKNKYYKENKRVIVLHFADHDPSGIDMTNDIEKRLAMFSEQDIEVKRMALNMKQVRQYNPPPNPAKETDSRFKDYVEKYGDKSWELDALEPNVIAEIVNKEVSQYIIENRWKKVLKEEQVHRDKLQLCADHWTEVSDMLDTVE